MKAALTFLLLLCAATSAQARPAPSDIGDKVVTKRPTPLTYAEKVADEDLVFRVYTVE
jgi:hypothetical protein